MIDWGYAQTEPAEELAELRFFTMKKRQPKGDVCFQIVVKEYATPPAGHHLRFFAEADKRVNQADAPLLPCGWGDSVRDALSSCLRLIRQFPYEEKGAV